MLAGTKVPLKQLLYCVPMKKKAVIIHSCRWIFRGVGAAMAEGREALNRDARDGRTNLKVPRPGDGRTFNPWISSKMVRTDTSQRDTSGRTVNLFRSVGFIFVDSRQV